MDQETFANFISNCGKNDFRIACEMVLEKAFGIMPINVDGAGDGGTDFAALNDTGIRIPAAYQITTQKSDIKNKAYRDAAKSIKKLKVKRFYFLSTYNLDETDCRALENEISDELDIRASVYSPRLIADTMIKRRIAGEFLDRIGYDDLHRFERKNVDYREMALHSYAILSQDTRNLKMQIYDDALLLILSNHTPNGVRKEQLVREVRNLLLLPENKEDFLCKRIDSLRTKSKIKNHTDDKTLLVISEELQSDINNRKIVYERELEDLSAAQVDILKDYGVEWTSADSRQVSVWIANTYMNQQLKTLKSVNAELADNFYRNIHDHGYGKLRKFLRENKKLDEHAIDGVIEKLLSHAATHPLLVKITSASVYIALEGTNPLAACKAIGAGSWHDVNLLVEPTLGLPFLCSILYKGKVNRYFDNAIYAINRAKELGISMRVPYYYIRECAGHLYTARKFNEIPIQLDPQEMQYSSNAFVSNYYALKAQGVAMPSSFMEYLATFSSAIRTERADYKEWIRAIMINIQSLFTRNGIEFQEMPTYSQDNLKTIEVEYSNYLNEHDIKKPLHLMRNDAISLMYTNDQYNNHNEIWMILTCDRTLINVAEQIQAHAWVNTPFVFLDFTEMSSKSLSEKKLSSLLHSMTIFSPSTLSIGARILDRIILYASDKLQDWQFQESIKTFKSEMVKNISLEDANYMDEIDQKTNEFLAAHGINIDIENDNNDVDIETEQET